jgi:hypothetical protein
MELWEKKLAEFCVRSGYFSPTQMEEFISIQKSSPDERHLLDVFMEYLNWTPEEAKNICNRAMNGDDSEATFVEQPSDTTAEEISKGVCPEPKIQNPASFTRVSKPTPHSTPLTKPTQDRNRSKAAFTITEPPQCSTVPQKPPFPKLHSIELPNHSLCKLNKIRICPPKQPLQNGLVGMKLRGS